MSTRPDDCRDFVLVREVDGGPNVPCRACRRGSAALPAAFIAIAAALAVAAGCNPAASVSVAASSLAAALALPRLLRSVGGGEVAAASR